MRYACPDGCQMMESTIGVKINTCSDSVFTLLLKHGENTADVGVVVKRISVAVIGHLTRQPMYIPRWTTMVDCADGFAKEKAEASVSAVGESSELRNRRDASGCDCDCDCD